MAVLKEKFISDFQLRKTGAKGWMILPVHTTLFCKNCGNEDGSRLSFIFDEHSSSSTFRCIKCGYSCRLEKYLWLVKKTSYIKKFREIKQEDILIKKELIKEENKKEISSLQETVLPLLFKRLKYSNYLQKRGANLDIYNYWEIGKTDFEKDLKNYIIFVIKENNIPIGWVARSLLSKKEIEDYNKIHERKILRWRNSKSDFGKIVFDIDEIDKNTETLIIVEGISSKLNVDCKLNLYKNNGNTKCCCTFGKKITDTQILKIKDKGNNIKNIILFYDVSDAIRELKKYSYKLKNYFENIKVVYHSFKNEDNSPKDAGDMTKEELLYCLDNKNLKDIFSFSMNILEKKKLTKK